jgi:hypothetical protein
MPNETKLAFIGSGPREERGQELRERYGDES